jgi:hypothetical protein
MVNVTSLPVNSYNVPEASLSFITPTSKFNRRYVAPGEEINTGIYEDKTVVIRDARPEKEKLTLEKNGFKLIDHKSKV